jgi:methylated-DNA-[protein]-cysteine S-methyltransferase
MIYFSRLHPVALKRNIYFARTRKGICFISFSKSENDFLKQILKSCSDEVMFAPKMLYKESGQIKKYLEGKRRKFTLKTDIGGSPFQMKVWNAISKVPYGKTLSYSKLAKNVKKSRAFRAVANACGRNPLPIIIPCHRIVAKDGSLGGYTGGLEIKKNLLKIENSL